MAAVAKLLSQTSYIFLQILQISWHFNCWICNATSNMSESGKCFPLKWKKEAQCWVWSCCMKGSRESCKQPHRRHSAHSEKACCVGWAYQLSLVYRQHKNSFYSCFTLEYFVRNEHTLSLSHGKCTRVAISYTSSMKPQRSCSSF